jgi:putative transcriptional regulator
MRVKIKLAQLLERRNLGQRELARKTGIRLASINEMCQNEVIRLPLANLAKICEALNCDIPDVLELEGKDRQE